MNETDEAGSALEIIGVRVFCQLVPRALKDACTGLADTYVFGPTSHEDQIGTIVMRWMPASADISGWIACLPGIRLAWSEPKETEQWSRYNSSGRRVPARPKPPAVDAPDDALEGASSLQIARRILSDLAPMAATGGELYRYDGRVWQPLSIAAWQTALERYTDELHISDALVRDTYACAIRAVDDPMAPAPGIAFADCFAFITDGEVTIQPHRPEYFARHALDVDWDARAECPVWLDTLRRTLSIDEDLDSESEVTARIEALAEFVGVALMGRGHVLNQCVCLLGPGGTGKSTIASVIAAIMPEGSVSAIPPHDWHHEYQRNELRGKRLNTVFELPNKEISASETFKGVVSGDMTWGRSPYGQVVRFAPTAAHLVCANFPPDTPDQSDAYWDRFFVLRCENRIRATEQDRGKDAAVNALLNERVGIIRWALEGALRLLARPTPRLLESASSRLAKDEWRQTADSSGRFVRGCCVIVEDAHSSLGDIYACYREYAAMTGSRPLAQNTLGTRLKALGVKHGRNGNGYKLLIRHRSEWDCRPRTVAEQEDRRYGIPVRILMSPEAGES